MLRYLWISALVLLLDQISKWWVVATLPMGLPQPVISGFFDLTLVHNPGAAFGILDDAGGWQRFFLGGIAVAAAAIIVTLLRRLRPNAVWVAVALALVLGGALGNLVDRLYLGYVIDFLDVYWKTHHWPAFNVADSAISVGALMLVVDAFRNKG